jgi:hypothetical protein
MVKASKHGHSSRKPVSSTCKRTSIGVEERSGGPAQAKAMLSRALQECPTSVALWVEPRASRKTKTKDNPLVVCTFARILWADRVVERARDWFGRATATNPDLGDIWGWWLQETTQDRGAKGSRQSEVCCGGSTSFTNQYGIVLQRM